MEECGEYCMNVRIDGSMLITAEDGKNAILMAANDKAMSPLRVFLASFGGCTAVDVLMILQRMREDVKEVRVNVSTERRKEYPRIFTRIHLRYVIAGNVREESVERAIRLSVEKYCSISAMLRDEVEVTRDYVILRE